MRTRPLGKTGIVVSELSVGTWGLSGEAYGPVPEDELRRVVERARAMGVTLFETADCYAGGKTEEILGEVLSGSDCTVVTKWGTDLSEKPPRKQFDGAYLRRAAEASKKRLGDVRIVGLLHNPAATSVSDGEAIETMKTLAADGLVATWGVSAGDLSVAQAALTAEAPVLSVAHNVLQVQPLRALKDTLTKQETGVLAHSVLFYGLLAGRWAPQKDFRSSDHRSERWPGGALRTRIRQLDALRPLISGEVTTMRSAAVRFVLAEPLVSSAVLGPRSSSQLDQIVRECRGELPLLSSGKLSALEHRLSVLDVPR